MSLSLSVILCTHNPDLEILGEALEALSPQLDPATHEMIIVDNASAPPLGDDIARRAAETAIVLREPKPGLVQARSTGIRHASAPLVLFVDDDNILAPDYLRAAVEVACGNPQLGAFAGRAVGRFAKPPGWLHRTQLGRYAVRNLGDDPMEGSGERWYVWEPFGAGLVVRSDVANVFAGINEQFAQGMPLGRRGSSLASGEDSLFSRIADRLGYKVGYRPELSLEHVIAPRRMTLVYLFKLMEGQGRSYALLEAASRRLSPAPRPHLFPLHLARRFLSRLQHPGLHEAITHLWWDIGYFNEREALADGRADRLSVALDQIHPRFQDAVEAEHEKRLLNQGHAS